MTLGQHESGARHVAEDSGTVTARLQSADGWPLANGILTITDTGGAQRARVQADQQGMVGAAGLPGGTYTVIITAIGYQPLARTAVVHRGRTAALGDLTLDRVGGDELPTAGLWTIDPVHSSILATAQHLGISSIHGRFNEFSGEIRVADQVESSGVDVRIEAASVDTANSMRDSHLRDQDFLDVERHPTISYRSTALSRRDRDRWDLDGDLTLCGVTRPVRLDVRFTGVGPGPWGGTRAWATATTQLRREDFARTFSEALSTGIAAIGTTLRVEIDIQAVRQD